MLSVKVTVVEVQALMPPSGATGDLRCSVTVVPHSESEASAITIHTKPIALGATTKWDEALEVEAERRDKLAVECWLSESKKDNLIGRVELELDSLVVGSSSDKWLALKAPGAAKPAGLLHALIYPKTKRVTSRRACSGDSNKVKPAVGKGPTFEPSDLEKWISLDELASLDDKERSRQKAILEFIETERSYNNDLSILQRVFINPIREKNLLSKAEMNSIFSNVEALLEVNKELMQELAELQEKRQAIKDLGQVLAKRESIFKLYAIFCSAIIDVNQRVEQFKEKNSSFAKFLEECFVRPECRLLPLDSFIHAPLSRLVKYPLLLGAVLKYTPDEHPDKKPLEKVYGTIMEIVNMVNERTRQVENVQALIKLQKTIANPNVASCSEPGNDFVDNQRYLVKEGPLNYIKADGKSRKESKIYVILFNDLLVLGKPVSSRPGAQVKVREKFPTKDIQSITAEPTSISSVNSLERVPSSDLPQLSASGTTNSRWRSMRNKAITEPASDLRIDVSTTKNAKPIILTFVSSSAHEKSEWQTAFQTAISVSTREQLFSFTTSAARTRMEEASSRKDADQSSECPTSNGDKPEKEASSPVVEVATDSSNKEPSDQQPKKEKGEKETKGKSRKDKGSSKKKKKKNKHAEEKEKSDPKEEGSHNGTPKGGSATPDNDGKERIGQSTPALFRKEELAEALAAEAEKMKQEDANEHPVLKEKQKQQKKTRRLSLMTIFRRDELADALASEARKVEGEGSMTARDDTKWKKFGTWGRRRKTAHFDGNDDMLIKNEAGKKKKPT